MKNTDFSLIKRPDVSSNNGAKLVLLYGWLNASQRAVQRFVDLYHESGYDVLYIPGRVIQFAWPPLSMKLARQVLATVSELEHYEHLLCHAISIGAYNHTSCMMLLQENPTMFQSFRNRLRGVIFDSLTLGSTKRMISGVRHGLSQNPLVQSLIPRLLSVYLCVTYKYTLNFFEKGVQLFQDFPLQVPTLFVYSRDDPMCDADLVDAIIKNWRENLKMTVSFICWTKSKHAMHLKTNTEDYKKAFSDFMDCVARHWEDTICKSKL